MPVSAESLDTLWCRDEEACSLCRHPMSTCVSDEHKKIYIYIFLSNKTKTLTPLCPTQSPIFETSLNKLQKS